MQPRPVDDDPALEGLRRALEVAERAYQEAWDRLTGRVVTPRDRAHLKELGQMRDNARLSYAQARRRRGERRASSQGRSEP